MTALVETFQQRSGDLGTALFEHMQLSFVSLIIAVLIAVPLGIFLIERKRIAEPIIQVTAIFQTIPSLAILGLLIPLVGIGTVPAVTALTIYSLLPILRNTYTGLTGIDPSLNEAADAMGMSRWRKLGKVQLPLALPVIMAGIRTAMVLIIGTATVAALIGAGGLGNLILLGIDRGDNNLILLGALPAALLAIVFDQLLRYFQKTSLKKTVTIMGTGLAIILILLAVPFFFGEDEDITISGKQGVEPEVLMNIYKLLIEDQSDITAGVQPNFGQTNFVFNALISEEIDIYTEFTGTVLTTFFDIVPEPGTSEEDVFEEARDRIQEEYDMTLLDPMALNNTYALAVTSEFAEENDIETISDLANVTDQISAGFTLEFADRSDGYPGIQEMYGISFGNVTTMDAQLRYTAIERGDINLIDAYSTDAEIDEYNLVVLEDDLGNFPPYQGAPLMLNSLLDEYPEIEDILSVLDGLIDDDQMRAMNYEVAFDGRAAEDVARDFLVEQGLLEE